MSKVIITLTDDENGDVDINAEFDPPLKSIEDLAPAQSLAILMIQSQASEEELAKVKFSK